MSGKIRWGVLGCAKIAVQKVIPAIQKSNSGEVVAIASRNIKKAQETAKALNIPAAYGSYDEILQARTVDAIYIPLPNHLHIHWALRTMQAGKHVLCEKPLGISAVEVLKFQEETRKYPNILAMEAFMYRFHPQWDLVRDRLDVGTIGEVKNIWSFFSYHNTDPHNIRNKQDAFGGALMDIGCYCISFARYLFAAEPVRVVSSVERDPLMKIDRLTSALLEFPGGRSSTFTCSTQLMPFQRVLIQGTAGSIEVAIPVNAPKDQTTDITIRTPVGEEKIQVAPVDQYTLQAEAFARAVLEKRPVPIALEDAWCNMRVIDAIFESEKQNSWITLESSPSAPAKEC